MDLTNTNSLMISNSYDEQRYKKSVSNSSDTKSNDLAKTEKATKEFEAYFINYMFKEMKKTIPQGGLFSKNDGEKIFEEMRDQKYAEMMANRGGIGLSRIMTEHLRANMSQTKF
ncbi:MAG: hypothetical protein DKM50_10785 [Candidatus Margulisiibacteriota bacterium]|nr:MAG: hypothetical protein A2X43_07595 [Candidatus Margulisbacteria bacterium GWD2_39_127]OGI03914.1 MAG: hypothetical protein A2X42_10140 [Candidatus Margulisbacteria bacterium GWF2_38_17]OGI08184.1 MAG: hypothetical protein A2X41_00555 [Candidatus Margulisbacteria bacterium GWE2_39_32]PZM78614.1 MAG: hypothetical protein DKM50_10785 [Candidatus Margulisiibacteriota bacterium]HAR61953.1 hypothetical protein [Candidatus Margulisiibacteriota bacterium]